MRNIFVGISATIATLLFGALNIHACSCGERQTPAKAYADASVVWIGTATKISKGGGRSGFGDLKVTLDVKDFLKGRKARPAVVFTSSQGGACGYPFEKGETYLIYGYRDKENGAISTGHCTRTREVDLGTVDDELEILRSLSVGRFEPRLYGAVEEITRGIYIGDRSPNRPMPGIVVIARGHSGTYKAKTDRDGRFRFVDIRPGEYVLDLELPETHKIGDDSWGFMEKQRPKLSFTVSSDDTPDFITVETRVNGRIGGRVTGADGEPVGKGVRITLVTRESAENRVEEIQYIGTDTDSKGFYEFDGIPEGEYLLGVNLDLRQPYKDNPYPKMFYPSVNGPTEATIIKLGLGQKLKGYDIKLPPALQSVPIRGRVLTVEGFPVKGISVYVTNQARHNFEDFERVETNENGEFVANCLEGLTYRISLYDSKRPDRTLPTQTIVPDGQNNEPLEFRIPQ